MLSGVYVVSDPAGVLTVTRSLPPWPLYTSDSVVVTFTTLGYGDVLPASSLGQVLAILEVSFGYLMGGLLIAILARRFLLG